MDKTKYEKRTLVTDQKAEALWPKSGETPTLDQKIVFQISQNLGAFQKHLHETNAAARFDENPHFRLISHGILLNAVEAMAIMAFIREGYFALTNDDILSRLPAPSWIVSQGEMK